MNRIALKVLGRLHHGFDVEVAVQWVGPHDLIGHVRKAHWERQTVFAAVDDGRLNAKVTKGSEDAQRNLAAVGNEHPLEGHGHGEEHTVYDALGPSAVETADRKSDTGRRR